MTSTDANAFTARTLAPRTFDTMRANGLSTARACALIWLMLRTPYRKA